MINVGVGAKMLEISISKEKENGVGAPCIIKADMIYLNFCSPLPIFERTVLTPLRKLQAKNSSYLLICRWILGLKCSLTKGETKTVLRWLEEGGKIRVVSYQGRRMVEVIE